MDLDLAYYRRRVADEQAAALSAMHSSVQAAHRRLAQLYEARLAELQVDARRAEIHLVSAA